MTAPVPPVAATPLPAPRGPVSARLISALAGPPGDITDPGRAVPDTEDLVLALQVCYELHYRGYPGVADGWEWHPPLLAFRARLETVFDRELRALVDVPEVTPAELPRALFALAAADDSPSLAGYVQRQATLGQVRELLIHRSAYQLKEADPHTWAIPRLTGRAKAALVEIQTDEYGGGRAERMHSALFAATMRAAGLDDTYGAYVDQVPAVALAGSVAASYFGLHRGRRGALVGHLAALEMTSSIPMRKYGNGLRRLGFDATATRFFDEHIEADAVHEQVAAHDLCGALAAAEPELTGDILLGAAVCLALDGRLATHLLGRWQQGLSSLREPRETVAA